MSFDSFFLVCLTTVFSIVNPLGALGPFLAMSSGESLETKKKSAMRASIVSGGVLLLCATAGTFIFQFYGISLPAVKISGGILLFLVALDMINARQSRTKSTSEEAQEGAEKEDYAIFPLAIPLISGPGSIVSVFILAERAQGWIHHAYVYLSILITMVGVYYILKFAHRLASFLGRIGINVFSRLMGLVLAAIAIQFVIDGTSAVVSTFAK
jgi:multiple antibiotic resistance protein